jgi:hypothetical protein
VTSVPAEDEPIVRVVIFLPLRKAQFLDKMKYLMKVDKSEIVERALEEAIRNEGIRRVK